MPTKTALVTKSQAFAMLEAAYEILISEPPDTPMRTTIRRLVALDQAVRSVARAVTGGHSSAFASIETFFVEHVGTVLTGEEVAMSGGISDSKRRVRELKEQKGAPILCGADLDQAAREDMARRGFPPMKPDDYILLDQEWGDPALNRIPTAVRAKVLARDGYRCRKCGKSPDNSNNVRVDAHHVIRVCDGGTNTEENLKTLCKRCHSGEHPRSEGRGRLTPGNRVPASEKGAARKGRNRVSRRVAALSLAGPEPTSTHKQIGQGQ